MTLQDSDTARTELAALLKQCLDKRGWSYRDLETASGVPKGTISHMMAGRPRTVGPETLHDLAQALDLPAEVLQRAADASRSSQWQLPARAQRLSPSGRRTLVAFADWLLTQEAQR